jgi:hypothetical protein
VDDDCTKFAGGVELASNTGLYGGSVLSLQTTSKE